MDEATKRRMNAYYYGFMPTGVDAIDKILSAVACAGKSFHHTEDWEDYCPPSWDHKGNTPVEWIQRAAEDAAALLCTPAAPAPDAQAGLLPCPFCGSPPAVWNGSAPDLACDWNVACLSDDCLCVGFIGHTQERAMELWNRRASPQPASEVARIRDRIAARLNNHLCEMKPGYDDSIVGFNEAWDIVRAVFDEAATALAQETTHG